MPNENDGTKATLTVGDGHDVDALGDIAIDELRACLDDPAFCKRLDRWLGQLPDAARRRETEVLSELGDVFTRTASDSETRADYFGNLANPGGVIAAALIGAAVIGTAALTGPLFLGIFAGAFLYVGGQTYRFWSSRSGKRDKERSDQCSRLADRHKPRD